jgi:dihydrofolate reductase
MISLVAALGKQRQLGLDNKLPWKLGDDMKHFRNLTMGHHVLMGRKTFQSIGRPLPGRINMIITRNADFIADRCFLFHSFDNAIKFADDSGETELFIIGGASIYEFSIENKLVDRMYLTEVDYDGKADAFFPEFSPEKWYMKKHLDFRKSHDNDHNFRIMEIYRKQT